jgi:hypothetical protein
LITKGKLIAAASWILALSTDVIIFRFDLHARERSQDPLMFMTLGALNVVCLFFGIWSYWRGDEL